MTTRGHATAAWCCLDPDGKPLLATLRPTAEASRAAAVVVAAEGDRVPARAIVLLVGERGWVPLGSTEIALRQQVAQLVEERGRLIDQLRRIGDLAREPDQPAPGDSVA